MSNSNADQSQQPAIDPKSLSSMGEPANLPEKFSRAITSSVIHAAVKLTKPEPKQ